MRALTIAKPKQGTVNEDAAKIADNFIAVSDGAGGGGIYADKWSAYLVEHLPAEPMCSFQELDAWIESIWEPFYNDAETLAKASGGLVLNKFYDEGSFATLAVIWFIENSCNWIAYGDSVAFCYNPENDTLTHSFGKLSDFSKPPYLINCKDELSESGFSCGTFLADSGCILFCTSDALAHYIIMMYELSHCCEYAEELQAAERLGNKESSFIRSASSYKVDFYKDILQKLINCKSSYTFEKYISKLLNRNQIALDDYSFVFKKL